jgi:hypothetical protein
MMWTRLSAEAGGFSSSVAAACFVAPPIHVAWLQQPLLSARLHARRRPLPPAIQAKGSPAPAQRVVMSECEICLVLCSELFLQSRGP